MIPLSYHQLPGVHASPNIQGDPAIYEIENLAADPDQLLEKAMQAIAPWDDKVVLDLGAGTGFHAARFHQAAQHVFAVEPHDASRLQAMQRCVQLALHNASVLKGSAEYVPLRDQSVDICHARFAYFFAPNCIPGLHELERLIRPGGTAFIIDNDLVHGTFAQWLQQTPYYANTDPAEVRQFWRDQGFDEQTIASEWRFERREDLEAVVRLEFGDALALELLTNHAGLRVDYHYKLYYRTY